MTDKNKNLLVELFVEELPPRALKKLGQAFGATLLEQLQAQGLAAAASRLTPFASPRRLAAHITAVAPQAADKAVSQKLMPVSVGLDAAGQPTPALLKKLQSLGADASAVAGLKRAPDGKAQALFYESQVRGATLAEGLQKALAEAIARLPIPKVMTYQLADGWTDVKFVRPAHALVALHGAEVVPVRALGLAAGDETRGHRFEAASATVKIAHADEYAATLARDGAVIAGFDDRKAEIARQLAAAAARVGGGVRPIEDEALLDEVTALVERPNVLLCQFEREFLEVPQECLILTMKANQKYFPLLQASGQLTHQFLVVSNIRPEDPSAVVGGNERVVRPRLADAKFFFDQDRKKPLASRIEALAKVVYHNKLGTQGERMARVRELAGVIANALDPALVANVQKAAELAKADLLTDMVGEFPELQGTMGRYYALADGLPAEIADAIEDHYKPRFAGDSLPRGRVGLAVALADKLETLAGLFAIGQLPTGDKDPFALRRHALGLVRMLMEQDLPLPLGELLDRAVALFPQAAPATRQLLADFIYERLAGLLREQGYSAQEVDAVLALQPQRLGEVARRLAAVRAFAALPEAPALAAANKRIANILRKAEGAVDASVREGLLKEDAEKALYIATRELAPAAGGKFDSGDYTGSLQTLAALRGPVDAFFDGVMVNAEEADLRANRLGLLATLHQAMNRVADLSRLAA
ncbi:glycine--tRNA ligase subunit beta [Ramlibacter tataouinensis]|uniref:Glycine--tRNA ligase beta subunit n=1 Tax=Ramlibacter tataouinensis (strain ATCC BAA-407 / DSM 14655 / LMG 21543 / TTB310) TaxID=365046 RepID=F5XW63_RAMTT|nr:glycine--tRNA ligase subunit beta [Ramlibacter tataouinensis]AEG91633.1 Candidate glycine--tRNA ligase beta chain (Glycyl-tRNA synthetase beta chain) [Ramlibacter tataouinensis TTB310]